MVRVGCQHSCAQQMGRQLSAVARLVPFCTPSNRHHAPTPVAARVLCGSARNTLTATPP